jgi:polyisoprenoid-binding protein YceI
LSVAGHTHEIVAPAESGSVRFDGERFEQAEIEVTFNASALKVAGAGEPAKDVPEVQRTMLGPKVLDVEKYPAIVFRSRQIAVRGRGDVTALQVRGDLSLHGVTKAIEAPVSVKIAADTITASGMFTIKQTDFGIEPVTAGLGAVKVGNELVVAFTLTAHR